MQDMPNERRSSEKHIEETGRRIEDMISRVNDPVQQGMLLIMSRFNSALEKQSEAMDNSNMNTAKIAEELTEHRADFQRHDKIEIKRMAWLHGAWWAIVGMFVVVLALAKYVTDEHMLELKQMRTDILQLHLRVQSLELSCVKR